MVPWIERPTIALDLGRPRDRLLDDVPPEAFAAARMLLDAVMQEIPQRARTLAYWIRLRTCNRFQREFVTLARQIHADWRDVVLANVSYDLMLAYLGCSTVVLPTPSGPVVARNMDWWPEAILAQASYLIRCTRGGRLQFASAGWPGAVGVVTGLSGRGFAVVLNAVQGPEKVRKTGYPVLLHLRRVIEDAGSFNEALKWLAGQTLLAPALFTLAGSRNEQRVVIERTPTRYALRWPRGDEPLVTTNDYRLLFKPEARTGAEIYETTCSRYDALCRFFADHRADRAIEDSALLYILSDPSVIQTITCQHVIMKPATGEMSLFVPRRLVEPLEPARTAAKLLPPAR